MIKPQWNLKQIRSMYSLSQGDVAKAIGVKSRGTVIAIEEGRRDLTSEEIGSLADYLGVEIVDLINFEMPNYNKYREMIVESLRRYKEYTNHQAPKTLLSKLVYLADFTWFYNTLQPMSGMKYRRDPYGPVPDQFFRTIDTMVDSGEIELEMKDVSGRSQKMQALSLSEKTLHEPNQYLIQAEVEIIDKVVRKWKDANVDRIVEFTHNQLPWQVTRPNEFIPYELITQEEPDNVY